MSEFAFQWLGALPLLLLTPPLALLLSYARAQRLQVIEAMGSARPKYRRLRDTLRLLAFVCLVLALARPGYAPHTESVSRTGRDVVFALDVSRSMLAQDVPPSRLEVAKQGIRDALERFKNERVGLILYAGSASILCPLTSDYGYVRFVLEQAHPRSVDFGGTTMQAAIQKAIDQVFMEGRENLQDLIILTDGEDNGSRLEATVQSLDERSVDTLLIGLGNPQRGSPIPIQNDEGQQIFLEQDGNTIYTQLDDDALHALAALSKRIQYRAVGTSPFNLGQVYQDYAKDLPIDSRYDENGIQIYHEAAPYFLITALVLLLLAEYWGARGIQFGQAAILLCALLVYKPSEATTSAFKDFYTQAFDSYQSGDYKTAEAQFAELYDHASKQNASPETLGSIQFNRGLCQIQLAQASAEDNPQTALIYAQNAKLDFLSAKRYRSDLNRAGIRLQTTALLIGEIEAKIEAQEKRNAELQAQMEALLEELKTLLVEQTKLREKLQATDPARFSNRKKMPERVIPEKETVTQQSSNFPKEQNIL
ncbi:MAG: VWA domain-containing protein, partial [Opitutales bacterium]